MAISNDTIGGRSARYGPVGIVLAAITALCALAREVLKAPSTQAYVVLGFAAVCVIGFTALALRIWIHLIPTTIGDPATSVEKRLSAMPALLTPSSLLRSEASKLFLREVFQGRREGDWARGFFAIVRTQQVWRQQVHPRLRGSARSGGNAVDLRLSELKQISEAVLKWTPTEVAIAEAAASSAGVDKFIKALQKKDITTEVSNDFKADDNRFQIMQQLQIDLKILKIDPGRIGIYITPIENYPT